MTTIPVSAAILRDRADALHATVDAREAHTATCTKAWCALCTRLGREYHDAYQSALDVANGVSR